MKRHRRISTTAGDSVRMIFRLTDVAGSLLTPVTATMTIETLAGAVLLTLTELSGLTLAEGSIIANFGVDTIGQTGNVATRLRTTVDGQTKTVARGIIVIEE